MKHVAEKISLIGSEGSGKTCFLAGLRWLSSPTEDTPFTITGKNRQSQEYLESLHSALEGGHRPPPSHKIDNLDLTAGYKKSRFNINVQDAPGEDFKRAALSGDDTHPIIVNILESQYIFICLDVDRDVRNRAPHLDRIEAVFAVLHRHQDECRYKKIAILLTKADASGIPQEEWTDSSASGFLKEYNSSFVQKLNDCRLDFNVFFVASLGSPMTNNEPPNPHGYDQIFAWLSNKRSQIAVESFLTGHRRAIGAVFVVILVGSGILTLMSVSEGVNVKRATDPTATEESRIAAISRLDEGKAAPILTRCLSNLEKDMRSASSIDELHRLYERVTKYCTRITMQNIQEDNFKVLRQQISDKLENEYIKGLDQLVQQKNKDEFDRMHVQYVSDRFSSRNKLDYVVNLAKQLGDDLLAAKRKQIGALVVDVDLKQGDVLRQKIKKISEFASVASVSANEKEEMRQAVKDMQEIMSNRKRSITFEQSGKLDHKDWNSYLRITIGEHEHEGEYKLPKKGYCKGAEPVWDCVEAIKWKVGDKIVVKWKCNKWYWPKPKEVATCEISGDCFALLNLLSSPCMLTATTPGYFVDGPYLKVKCEDFRNAKESKRLIEKYLVPGTYWQE